LQIDFYRYGITCALLASMVVMAGAAPEAWDK